MKKVSVILIILFAVLIVSNSAIAQDKAYRAFGIGVSITDLNGWYGSAIHIPINLSPGFRLEPFIGFMTAAYDDDGEDDDSETGMQFGLGIYPTIRKGSAVIYIGGRTGIAFFSGEYKDNNGDVYVEESDFTFFIGPVLGGEYYFNPHFSLGGEVGIMLDVTGEEMNYTSEFQPDTEDAYVIIGTQGKLFIRFYF